MRELLLWLLRPLMRSWLARSARELQSVPRPTDMPQAHAPGIDSDRILIVGSGPAVGWGVSSHDLSLPGALARALSSRTGRGAAVDVIADPDLFAAGATALLDDAKLWRYDAVLVMVGINDAVALTSTAEYKRSMRELLGFVGQEVSRSAQVFVVGIPPVRQLRVYEGLLGHIAERHAALLNKCLRSIAQGFDRTSFVTFAPESHKRGDRYRSPEEYRDWALILAEAIAQPLIDTHVHVEEPEAVTEIERQRAVDALGIAGSPPEDRFDRIVDLARKAFDTQSALFSVIDHDRQWNKARANFDFEEIPREGSACSFTIQSSGALVIPDTLEDERVAGNPLVSGGPHVRFYAGFPVEAPTGERIGSLCVLDDEPRPAAQLDVALLREFALRVQAELWKDRVSA